MKDGQTHGPRWLLRTPSGKPRVQNNDAKLTGHGYWRAKKGSERRQWQYSSRGTEFWTQLFAVSQALQEITDNIFRVLAK